MESSAITLKLSNNTIRIMLHAQYLPPITQCVGWIGEHVLREIIQCQEVRRVPQEILSASGHQTVQLLPPL